MFEKSPLLKGNIQELVITGWGKRRNDQSTGEVALTNVLQQVALPVTNEIERCKQGLSGIPQICIGGLPLPKGSKYTCSMAHYLFLQFL